MNDLEKLVEYRTETITKYFNMLFTNDDGFKRFIDFVQLLIKTDSSIPNVQATIADLRYVIQVLTDFRNNMNDPKYQSQLFFVGQTIEYIIKQNPNRFNDFKSAGGAKSQTYRKTNRKHTDSKGVVRSIYEKDNHYYVRKYVEKNNKKVLKYTKI
jgi:hypothetical protein